MVYDGKNAWNHQPVYYTYIQYIYIYTYIHTVYMYIYIYDITWWVYDLVSSVKNGQTSLLGPRGSHQGHQAVTSRTWRELWAARLRLDSKGWSMSWLSWWSLDGAWEIPNMGKHRKKKCGILLVFSKFVAFGQSPGSDAKVPVLWRALGLFAKGSTIYQINPNNEFQYLGL